MGRVASTHEISQLHVLAVDDNFVERKVIEKLLKQNSSKVTSFDSVSKALQFLEQKTNQDDDNKVNMIITDYCMPEQTGYDLLKRVKESSKFKDIPVVLMSSENVDSRIERCISEGAEDFLLKPVKFADVKRVLSHLVMEVHCSPKTM